MPVYVRCDGPTYTRKGENESLSQEKAYGFKQCWAAFIEGSEIVRPDPDIISDFAWLTTDALFKSKDLSLIHI